MAEAANENANNGLKTLIGLGVVILGVYACVQSLPEVKKGDLECASDGVSAYITAKEFVKKRLRAPATAVFPSQRTEGVFVTKKGDCQFSIVGFFDAQNSFGALLRGQYFMDLRYDKETDYWHATNINVVN